MTSAAIAPAIAVRLNLTTVTQHLSSRGSLAAALAGGDKRRVVLLRSAPDWDGPSEPVWGDGLTARVATAPSVLGVHALVLEHFAGETGPPVLVVLTDREQRALDPAILARVHKQRVEHVDTWDVVRQAFGADQLDTRLKDSNWAAEALLEATPGRQWPRVAGGLLSRRTALAALALRRLRLGRYTEAEDGDPQPGPAPVRESLDEHTLLRWSLAPGGPEAFLALRAPERSGLAAFLSEDDQGGLTGRALFALVEAEHGADAVAFGLVCAALWQHAQQDADSYRARGRAERWFGADASVSGDELDALALAFGRSAEEFVGTLLMAAARGTDGDREARRLSDTLLGRAAVLVRQFGAESAARHSPVLSAGLEARFAAFGEALSARRIDRIGEAVASLQGHQRADEPDARPRVERARMAQRLVRWLATEPATECRTVADGIAGHVDQTGWVDWAREYIEAGGDPDPQLKAAYDTLGTDVRQARHEIDRSFAQILRSWTEAGTSANSMLTVESFLDEVVRPVVGPGSDRRVLLLVLDGMSAAIASELGEELRLSWAEFDPVGSDRGGAPRRRAMAAALPTVTAVSRTSLFAGTLMKGTQADEKKLFATHRVWGRDPAAVFHKDDLRAESSGDAFGPELADALTDGDTHVAVVLNAIDDRLAKEQKLGDGAWRTDHVPALRELLRTAAAQGMAVLVTSDHGHVVDRRGRKVKADGAGSARHREATGALDAAEVSLAGPRVVWPEQPGGSIVALWDADSRYTTLKAGYHGGASLAEFTIPVLAFLPFGAAPPDAWRELGAQRPSWWGFEEEQAVLPANRTAADTAPTDAGRNKPTKAQAEFAESDAPLSEVEDTPPTTSEPTTEQPPRSGLADTHQALVTALTSSEVFAGQWKLLARKPRGNKHVKAILALLEEGGTLPATALAQRVGDPPSRGAGFAAVLGQLLNHDGVQVLETLPDGRTLRLHTTRLREQFGLD